MHVIVGLISLGAGSLAHTEDGDAQVRERLVRGYPEVAAMLERHPAIVEYLRDPMWRDVVLHAPRLPGSRWQIHDLRRPQPPRVEPASSACTAAAPPQDARVIFDGTDLEGFGADRGDWQIIDGALVAGGRASHRLATREALGDMQLHLEFATPNPAGAAWQYRGNSGVFLMGRYELQILDSFDNPTYPDGQSGALYGQAPPMVNASRPPGAWQCFDVVFIAPRFRNGRVHERPRLTVFYNGVLIHHDVTIPGPTQFAQIGRFVVHASREPFTLQDHGDATSRVRFRNIWVRDLQAREAPP